MSIYADFLEKKKRVAVGRGITDDFAIPSALYDWQKAIVRLGRRFIGFELKPSYANVAAKNLATAASLKLQGSLFAAEVST